MQLRALRAGLKALLKDRDMTIAHLAHVSGVSPSTITNFLSERHHNIGLSSLRAIYDGLGCDIEIGVLDRSGEP